MRDIRTTRRMLEAGDPYNERNVKGVRSVQRRGMCSKRKCRGIINKELMRSITRCNLIIC